MYMAGCPFYLSENGIWLTKKVEPEYFEEIDTVTAEEMHTDH